MYNEDTVMTGLTETKFDQLIMRAAQPVQELTQKDEPESFDDYNDTKTHQRNVEDTSDLPSDTSR